MNDYPRNILDRFNAALTGDNQWEARCPAHDDDKASLCLGIGDDGRMLVHCQAGCDVDDVLRRVGLKLRDLFPSKVNGHSGNGKATKGTRRRGKIVATYNYADEQNQLLYQVCRFDPKGFCQRRPDGSGGWINQLSDVRRLLYRLPQLLASKGPVFIAEGEKDVDRLASLGFTATTNAQGAGKWQDGFSDFLVDRAVVILPDNDEPGREHAQQVARSLYGKAGAIRIVELPGLPPKGDVSDWLNAGGTREQLIELVKAAPEWTSPADVGDSPKPAKEKRIEEADDDPHRLARAVMERVPNLRYWQGEFYRYRGQRYVREPASEIRGRLTQLVKDEFDRLNRLEIEMWKPSDKTPEPPPPLKVTCSLVRDVEQALQSLCRVAHERTLDSWLDDETVGSFVSVANGIVDINRASSGEPDCLFPHSPNWFSLVSLPFEFDPAAACPKWTSFLAKNLEGDAERIAIFQEWCGYCLTADTSYQKFLLMVGEGANGKSVACAVLTALLGPANVSNVPLEGFGQRFQLMQTVGKLANIAAEVGELDKVGEGHLKAFTAGDRMQFERKYRDPLELTPTARLVLATNNLPRFSDRTNGLWRRLLLMPFRVTIPPVDRIIGMDKPEWWLAQGELPGIFRWALEGLKRLREQGRFTESEICNAALAKYRKETNKAGTFLVENYREHPAGQIPTLEMFERYRVWCTQHGYLALGDSEFGKEVARTFPKSERKYRGPRGQRAWVYVGVCQGGEEIESVC